MPARLQHLHLVEQDARVDHDAVADDADGARVEDARRDQAHLEGARSLTMVCPAFGPPLQRTTTRARLPSISTILPLPSSPHWQPRTAITDKVCSSRAT